MNGGGALTRTYLDGGDLAVASLDEDAAFSMVETPRWFWAAPPVRAYQVWSALPQYLKSQITPHCFVAAKYKRLSMGLAHSVYILMRLNMSSIGRALFEYNRRFVNTPIACDDIQIDEGQAYLDCDSQDERRGC